MSQSESDKQIDDRIARAYGRAFSGVAVPILAVPKIYDAARLVLRKQPLDDAALESLLIEIASRYAV